MNGNFIENSDKLETLGEDEPRKMSSVFMKSSGNLRKNLFLSAMSTKLHDNCI